MSTFKNQPISYEEIRELFLQGIDCSQVVAGAFAKESGVDQKLLRKISACFGGGCIAGKHAALSQGP